MTLQHSESHYRLRAAIRKFVMEEIMPDAIQNDESGTPADAELYKKMGKFGWLACRIGPGPHLKMFNLPGGVKAEEFD